MQKFFAVLFAVFFVNAVMIDDASAQRRPNRPGRPGEDRPGTPRPRPGYPHEGEVSCRAYSTKFLGGRIFGYSSCQRCLESNKKCHEVCTENVHTCTVEGVDYNGRTRLFKGAGRDRFAAEREARQICDWNRNMRSCRTKSCGTTNRTVSDVRCQ